MARKKIVKASPKDAKDNGKSKEQADSAIEQGIWGIVYLAIGALLLISMLFYSPKQFPGSADKHTLGPWLGTSLALGMFYIFGRVTAFAFPIAVGYIGVMRFANRNLRLKWLIFIAALMAELCLLLAVRHMPGLSADGLMATAKGTGSNFIGLAMVYALVPLFGGRMFGPYFITSLLIAITVMIALRIRPQAVAAFLAAKFVAMMSWLKNMFVDVKARIGEEPPIRQESAPKDSKSGDDGKSRDEGDQRRKRKPSKKDDGETPIVAAPPSTQTKIQASADDGCAVDSGEDAAKELTPEEETKKRLADELKEFMSKRNEPIKIFSEATPDVEPADDDEGTLPIYPPVNEENEDGLGESSGQSKRKKTKSKGADGDEDNGDDEINGDDEGCDGNGEDGGDDDFAVSELTESKPYEIPSLDILPDPPPLSDMIDRDTIERNSAILLKTLDNFGVVGKVVGASQGPVVTRYEIELAPGVKISRVTNLQDDISMAVSGQKIRIQAPIPGKSAIGIELPNAERQTVFFKHILLSDAFRKSSANLPVVIGTNIAGAAYITDITKMPHVLIAGQTGSGKSVCINSLICTLLMTKTPKELRLIMIDPKKVELASYEGIPHLLSPVVTESKEAVKALQWGVMEMERRYRILAKVGARKLDTFNERVDEGKLEGVLDEEENKRLPYIVIIVDELADLMMTASKDVEGLIQRIAQLARAVGIHLIVATQRPSVDIITGPIKANLTSRIAFRTIQSTDSRTILGHVGAEKLLGMGDMLFLRNGAPDIERFHGAFISEEDVDTIVAEIRAQQVRITTKLNSFHDVIKDSDGGDDGGDYDGGDRDPLFADAARIIVSIGQGSTSLLQRRMKIGFARAGRLMDEMERAGIVGPSEGSKVREVLMRPEDLERVL